MVFEVLSDQKRLDHENELRQSVLLVLKIEMCSRGRSMYGNSLKVLSGHLPIIPEACFIDVQINILLCLTDTPVPTVSVDL